MNDVVIIGSGIAGLTAAIYLARSGISPVVVCGNNPGGQLMQTDCIENYPGFEKISGAELMMKTMNQAEKLGTKMVYERVLSVSKKNTTFEITISSNEKMKSRAVLIATGATHKRLGCKGEAEFANKGVSWCATCDGAMSKGKPVAVIGGGNTAVMEALFLSNIASKVYLIHRRDTLRADEIMQKRVFAKSNIECVWNSNVEEIIGDTKVTAIKLNSGKTIDVSAVFVAIGVKPETEFVKDLVELDNGGYVISAETKTSVPGIFVAGDVENCVTKQAVYAAGRGCLAAQQIERYLGIR
ncbi:MAG: thioredoxin-disulfide reductase [Alphaproteobacteria bacterium]|nr:thioredoxin-disulfide reductase [Alphaproteobacteria bacterium]